MPDAINFLRGVSSLVLGILLSCSLMLSACNSSDTDISHEPDPPKTNITMDVSSLVTGALDLRNDTAAKCGDSWYIAYVRSRIVPILAPDRTEILNLGPWTALPDRGATDARSDGSLTEWADLYYITHDWSDYGQQILALWNGDRVTVNGRTVTVSWVCNYPKDSYLEEVRALGGTEAVVFQTCYPNSDFNRIVFAS